MQLQSLLPRKGKVQGHWRYKLVGRLIDAKQSPLCAMFHESVFDH